MRHAGQKRPAKEILYERYNAPFPHDNEEDRRVKAFWEKIKKAREAEKENKSTNQTE